MTKSNGSLVFQVLTLAAASVVATYAVRQIDKMIKAQAETQA